jgi:hypothetical protein
MLTLIFRLVSQGAAMHPVREAGHGRQMQRLASAQARSAGTK